MLAKQRDSQKIRFYRKKIITGPVIGIDPGTATVGFAVVEGTKINPCIIDFGVIETDPNLDMETRLHEIGTDLNEVIKKHKPTKAIVESLFYFKNQKTIITVAQARGVILYECSKNGLEIISLTPLQVKQSLTGYGRAMKGQVQEMVKRVYKLDSIPKPDDAADGLALAWLGLS